MLSNTKIAVICRYLPTFFITFALEMKPAYLFFLIVSCLLAACGGQTSASSPTHNASAPDPTKQVPAFSGDSAFSYVAQTLSFGARVPGSEAQKQCSDWLIAQLKRFGADVKIMRTTAQAYDGTVLPIVNIVGSFKPEARNRILIMSHWDSRHVADEDPDPAKRQQPVMGANDGASGVGVILELARQASLQQPNMGIDLFLTDAEDYGAPDDWQGSHREEWWALGTQEWCRNPHVPNYRATYGILLDMVGAPDATFYREYYSDYYASDIVSMIWKKAAQLGYRSHFIDADGGGITDDHVFVNRLRGIPCIDIIDTRPHTGSSFYPYWHTTEDTLDKIDRKTLQMVGEVIMQLIY